MPFPPLTRTFARKPAGGRPSGTQPVEPQVATEPVDVRGLVESQRVKELRFREAFYRGTQHDWKVYDMNGRMVRPGRMSTQPLLSGATPTTYVPLDQRRPSAPYRVGRKIVSAFTAMLFGHGRWPGFRSDDPVTQDWAQALSEAMALEVKMARARNIGGACGTVGISWAFVDGEPRVTVHPGHRIHVLEWVDEAERIPAHVMEVYQAEDGIGKQRKLYWRRRDWTCDADLVFQRVEVGRETTESWVLDDQQSFRHDDGFCHFVWIENVSDDEDTGCDGEPDYAETYETMMVLDMINSVNCKGAAVNLDPTLVLGIDQMDLGGAVVRKGSDNALVVGRGGSAQYLELGGSSLDAGAALVTRLRDQILEVAECVLLDPDRAAASGQSAVALRLVYAPMIGKCDLLRHQYGAMGIVRLIQQMTDSARARMAGPVEIPIYDDDGVEISQEKVLASVRLPPKIEEQPVMGPDGTPLMGPDGIPVKEAVATERHPGEGRIWLEWGPYFRMTASDHQSEAQSLTTANGGKAVISQKTAVELHANSRDIDANEEWTRVQQESADDAATASQQLGGMTPGFGGEVMGADDAVLALENAQEPEMGAEMPAQLTEEL